MKTLMILVIVVAVLSLAYFAYLGHVSRTGTAAGIVDGKLGACPAKPNCVCSEFAQDDAHFIEPLPIGERQVAQLSRDLVAIVEESGGRVETARQDYIAATYRSALFGFVDDIEFRIDAAAGQVHIRSASRVGHSDLGANRKRLESIRAAWRGAAG